MFEQEENNLNDIFEIFTKIQKWLYVIFHFKLQTPVEINLLKFYMFLMSYNLSTFNYLKNKIKYKIIYKNK